MRHRRLPMLAFLVIFLCWQIGAAAAQQTAHVRTIGHLLVGTPTPHWAQLWDELRRLGYVEGRHLVVERRYPNTREQLAASAADLIARKVDIIVTGGTPAALAAKKATTTIPIVFSLGANPLQAGANPVQRGLVASYERPGGNMTGYVEAVVPDRELEILKEAVPGIARVACPCHVKIQSAIGVAARKLGLELQDLDVMALQKFDMQQPEHFARFVEHTKRAGADAILMPNLQGYGRFLPLVGRLAAENRIPAIGFGLPFAESGGLLSFGPKEGEAQIAVASIVHRIFQGARPGDIPVVHQRTSTLAVNLKTAENLGVIIPPLLLNRSDVVIR